MNARALVLSLGLLPFAAFASDPLAEAFRNPPPEARPHTWWHWMNSNVSKAGITADLEAMARVGLGGVQLFDAGLLVPKGKVAFDTTEWYDHIAFAAHEAERLGLSFGLSNCSGWSSTGGPWITPEYGMKFVTNVTAEVRGPKRATIALPRPKKDFGFYRDIAVVAFPTPHARAAIPAFDRRVFRRRGLPEEAVDVAPMHPDEFGPEACVDLGSVRILDVRPDADGNVTWDVPEGRWTVIRFGYVCNGMTNHPGSSGGVGLECDKLDAKAMDLHFDSYLMKVRRAIGDCRAFDNILIDSYEVNAQNWTHGFEKAFRARKGYDILPYLPVLAAYPVGSVARTDAFLSDFRRVIADLFAENYAGRMAARCREIGVQFACEPYGTSPSDDLQYGAMCDIPMCEFWTSRTEDAIRYFSGTATYVRRLTVARPQPGERVILDLGDVRDIAEAEVNGRALPVLWKRPFRTDVTDALTDGEVELKVRVTNRWPNRMIGDERLCAEDAEWQEDRWWHLKLLKSVPDWVEAGLPSPTGRKTFSLCKLWKASDELLPSGLLGPVRFIYERERQ